MVGTERKQTVLEMLRTGDLPPLFQAANENHKVWQNTAIERPLKDADPQAVKDCALEPQNDMGNARRFVRHFGSELIFVREVGWHHWEGTHWRFEGGKECAQMLAQATAERIQLECECLPIVSPLQTVIQSANEAKLQATRLRLKDDLTPEEEQRMLQLGKKIDEGSDAKQELRTLQERRAKFAIGSGNKNRLNAMIEWGMPRLTKDPSDLDTNPVLFNVENGTIAFYEEVDPECPDPNIDRKRWAVKLKPHDRTDLITKVAPVFYDPNTDCPKFREFLQRMQPNENIRKFLQEYFGYALTGRTDEQCLLFNVGGGANGKSTFLEVISQVMGPYAMTVNFESIAGEGASFGGGSQANPDLARLAGARLVRTSEPEHGRQLKEGLLKWITGGEPVLARHLNKRFFEFKPQLKLTLSANQRPEMSGVDYGIWRRVRLVPWDVKIPEGQRRRFGELVAELLEERSGILNWLIEGALRYFNHGLTPPAEIIEATENYRQDKDPIGVFVHECVLKDEESCVPARQMYEAYTGWCRHNAVRIWSEKSFAEVMVQKGFEKLRSQKGMRYLNVRLEGVPEAHLQHYASDEVVPV